MPFLMFPLVAILSAGLVFGGGAHVNANGEVKFPPIVQKLVDKFNLDPAKVQEVVDENRAEVQAKVEAKQEDKLNKLVTDGKLTAAQEAAIKAKQAELRAWAEDNKDEFAAMTPEQRKAALDAKRAEVEAWAKEQGIDLSVLAKFGLHRYYRWGMFGPGMGLGLKMHGSSDDHNDDDNRRGASKPEDN